MTQGSRVHGLYAITDPCAGQGQALLNNVHAALQGGARVLQYRDKSEDRHRRSSEAEALRALCADHGALFIINDDIELAHQVKADGVHLGQDDADYDTARTRLGPDAIIGISCYNRLPAAQQAVARGADYVAFGRFFASASKPEAVQADTDLVIQARARLSVPIVAIGGITPENGGLLIERGADALAVIRGVFGADDIEKTARRFASLFDES
ncbi:MAG: thiamine phosphate synthase [Gammaproteobacteria bacterium]|nr:thiamine phosphate synthase [Gammaproteobacteria bacterium]